MAYNQLSTCVMIQVSQPWVREGSEARLIIEADPRMAGFVADIDDSVQRLVSLRPVERDREAQALTERAQELSAEYDQLGRCSFSMLDAVATAGKVNAQQCARVRDLLFPHGLSLLRQSYRDKAGHAIMLAQRITDDDRQVLRTIGFADTTLERVVARWLDAGKALGRVENQRTTRVADAWPTARDVTTARHRWIRVVRAVEHAAELAELDDIAMLTLFGGIRDAEADAARKRQGESDGEGEESVVSGDSSDADGDVDVEAAGDGAVVPAGDPSDAAA